MGQHPERGALWYVVRCQPRRERLASASLVRQIGLTVYLPELTYHRCGELRYTPFFPCYLFVQADLSVVATSKINATTYVGGIIAVDGRPQPLSSDIIEALRQRIDALNQQGGLQAPDLLPGSTVRLKSGPLEGLQAVFVGPTTPRERVRVLIEFMGQQRTVEVSVDILEPDHVPAVHPPRRTRGRGRTIRHA